MRATLENAARAGFAKHVHAERRELADLPAAPAPRGLARREPAVRRAARRRARRCKASTRCSATSCASSYVGWQAAVLTGNPPLGRELKIKAKRTHTMFNGPIECRLLRFDIEPKHFEKKRVPGALPAFETRPRARGPVPRCSRTACARTSRRSAHGRARKASRAIASTTRTCPSTRSRSTSTRRPSTPSAPRFVYVQEYAPPATIDAEKARARREEAFSVIPEVLDVPRERVHVRTRRKQKGGAQYEKLAERGEFEVAGEGGLELLVNFTDYLDTGLFLDHRPTRARIRELAAGKTFLNLFAYTATASVFAAAGGARATTSVDLSHTYLDWARRNFDRNGFDDTSAPSLAARRRARVARAAAARALRPDLPRSADDVALEAHGAGARRAARPRRADPLDAAAARARAGC